MKPALRAVSAGVSSVRLHDGRHTAETLLLEQGVPARVVMEILGHASTRITLDVNSHVADDLWSRSEAVPGVIRSGR